MACCEVSHEEKPEKVILSKGAPKQAEPRAENPARLADVYIMNAIQPGEWPKAGDIRAVLERRADDRDVCRAAAKAAENIASQDRGVDALVERGVVQQLALIAPSHSDDLIDASTDRVVSCFWKRADSDPQWFLLPAPLTTGRALADAGHPGSANEVLRVAVRLHQKGCNAAAMDAYQLAIDRLQSSLGATHASTMQARNNLAVLLEERGQLAEAEKLHLQVLEACEKLNGPDHADVLSSRFNLAVLRSKQGRMKDAQELYQQVAERREKALGPKHPDTLRAKSNYAYHLQKCGKLKDSEELFRYVVDERHRVLGRDDPQTLQSRCHLAMVLARQGSPAAAREAEAHFREVVKGREERLGRDHAETITTLSHFAVLLEQTRPEEAERWREEVFQRFDSALPVDQRRAKAQQGSFVARLEPAQASAMLQQVVERREAELGADHVDTLGARSELASHKARTGAAAEALTMRRSIAERSAAALGSLHAQTIAARIDLAASLRQQNEMAEAEKLYQETMAKLGEALAKRNAAIQAAQEPSATTTTASAGSPSRLAVLAR